MDLSGFDQPGFSAKDIMAAPPTAASAAPKSQGGLMGMLGRVAQPFEWFAKTAIVNPIREEAARATGNQQAYQNALQAARQNLVGSNNVSSNNATNAANFVKQLAGNTAQVGANLIAPESSAIKDVALAGLRGGAMAGGGAALANNQNVLKGALEGGAAGGVISPIAAPVLGGALKVLGFGGRAGAPTAEAAAAPSAASNLRGNISNEFQNMRASAGGYQAGAKLPGSGPAGISLEQSQKLAALEDKHGIPAAAPTTKLRYIQGKLNDTGQQIDAALQQAGNVPLSQQDLQAMVDSHLQNLNTNPKMAALSGSGLTNHTNNLVNAFLGKSPAAADIVKASGGQITEQDLANMPAAARQQVMDSLGVSAPAGESPIKNAADLNQFIRGLDNRINYLRGEGFNVPGEEQATQLLRQHLSDQLNKIVPDVATANKAYSELKQLEAPALMENTRLSNTGGGVVNRLLNNNLVKGAEAKIGQVGARVTAPSGGQAPGETFMPGTTQLPSMPTPPAAPAEAPLQGELVSPGGTTPPAAPPNAPPTAPEAQVVAPSAPTPPSGSTPPAPGAPAVVRQAARTRLTNIGPGAAIGSMAGGGRPQQQQPTPTTPTAGLMTGGQMALPQASGTAQASQYPIENMMYDIQRDPAKASTYMDLYKMMNPSSSTSGKLSTAETNNVDALRSAASSLDTYMQQVKAAGQVGPGTAQVESTLAGMPILNRLVGQQGANLRGMEAQRTDIASMLAKSLTGSARPAASIIKKWEESIPNVTDTPQVAQAKYNNLMQQIGNRLQLAQVPAGQNIDMSQLTGGQ